MKNRVALALCVLCLVPALPAPLPQAGRNTVTIRGQRQDVYYVPARGMPQSAPDDSILFLPGDGGWRGFAITIAETMASWGRAVYGVDTKRYLESFTTGRTALSESDVMADMRALGQWAVRDTGDRLIFIGWSEGAALGVLAVKPPENHKVFAGLAVIGLPQAGILGWRWADNITYVTKKEPNEPHFAVAPHLPSLGVPFFMVHSTHDEYTPPAEAKELLSAAREPKRLALVDGRNHRFDGNQVEFFRALRAGVEWIARQAR